MKKNIVICVLAIIAAFTIESTIFFHGQANKLHRQNIRLAKYLSEVRQENETLRKRTETAKTSVKDYKIESYAAFRVPEK